MTHAERRDRRKAIARYVREHGKTWEVVASAAREFGVSQKTVIDSCKQWKVKLKRSPRAPSDVMLSIVADLLNTTDTLSTIAERHRVTSSYVSQVYIRCRKVKICLTIRSVGGQWKK